MAHEDSNAEWKTWQVYCLQKNNNYVLKFDLKESRDGFCQRGRGRSFHVEQLKTEKVWEPTVESLAQGIWRLRAFEAEQRVWEGV